MVGQALIAVKSTAIGRESASEIVGPLPKTRVHRIMQRHEFHPYTLYKIFVFGTMTNKRTIISRIITLLHVSTLSCHPQGAFNQYFSKLHK